MRALAQESDHGLCSTDIDTDVRLVLLKKPRIMRDDVAVVNGITNELIVAIILPYRRDVAVVKAGQLSYQRTDCFGRDGCSISRRTRPSLSDRSSCTASWDWSSLTSCGS